jgi:hypothetical protein
MSEFIVQDDAVWMVGAHKPWRMSDHAVDTMLDLLEDAGAGDLFNRLYEAQRKAMGPLHTPRVTSLRGLSLVVDNAPRVIVRQMLSASVAEIKPSGDAA